MPGPDVSKTTAEPASQSNDPVKADANAKSGYRIICCGSDASVWQISDEHIWREMSAVAQKPNCSRLLGFRRH